MADCPTLPYLKKEKKERKKEKKRTEKRRKGSIIIEHLRRVYKCASVDAGKHAPWLELELELETGNW